MNSLFKNKIKKYKLGFTLIELLGVIMLLSIIALISTPIISKIIMNAKIKTYQINASEIINLSEVYFISNHDFNSKYTIIDLTKIKLNIKGKKLIVDLLLIIVMVRLF